MFPKFARANPMNSPSPSPIYIRSDGTIDPLSAPITRVGDVYTVTCNMSYFSDSNGKLFFYTIEVQKDNIVLDGAGYILKGSYQGFSGIELKERANVTVKNLHFYQCGIGIYMSNSSNNRVEQNVFENCEFGVCINSRGTKEISSQNVVNRNRFLDPKPIRWYATIGLGDNANNNFVSENILSTAAGNGNTAFRLFNCSNNTFAKNTLLNYNPIIRLQGSGNIFHQNNFVNSSTIHDLHNDDPQEFPTPSISKWDEGLKGNFWNDYEGMDRNRDGIGDIPFKIDESNVDNHPLMNPTITTEFLDEILKTIGNSSEVLNEKSTPIDKQLFSMELLTGAAVVSAVVATIGLLVFLKKASDRCVFIQRQSMCCEACGQSSQFARRHLVQIGG
jgi:parallel beta-helix repeat protein